jgi:uncharacterized protein with von Willebrand factor type A (vWA) domain
MGTISRLMAALRIVGDELDPDEITRLLGKAPTTVQRRGHPMRKPSGQLGRIMPFSSWSLSADDSLSGDLDAQVDQILDRTAQDLAVWRGIASTWRMHLFCGLFLRDHNEGLSLSPTSLRALGDREILLDLDIYGAGPIEGWEE